MLFTPTLEVNYFLGKMFPRRILSVLVFALALIAISNGQPEYEDLILEKEDGNTKAGKTTLSPKQIFFVEISLNITKFSVVHSSFLFQTKFYFSDDLIVSRMKMCKVVFLSQM